MLLGYPRPVHSDQHRSADGADDNAVANCDPNVRNGAGHDRPREGHHFFRRGDSVPVSFTLPAGWNVSDVFVNKPDSDPLISVSFWDVAEIYADPCQSELVDPPVGPTVDDLVLAWANVPTLNATAARDITVDGYQGQQFDLTAPDFNPDECQQNIFALWREDGQPADGFPARWVEPNEHLQMWVLDVNGTRLVISAGSFPDTSAEDRAEIDEIVNSIQIG